MISYICHVRSYVISYITYVKQKNLKISLISYRNVFEPLDGHRVTLQLLFLKSCHHDILVCRALPVVHGFHPLNDALTEKINKLGQYSLKFYTTRFLGRGAVYMQKKKMSTLQL